MTTPMTAAGRDIVTELGKGAWIGPGGMASMLVRVEAEARAAALREVANSGDWYRQVDVMDARHEARAAALDEARAAAYAAQCEFAGDYLNDEEGLRVSGAFHGAGQAVVAIDALRERS